MRVIIKHPRQAPFSTTIGSDYKALASFCGDAPASCISHGSIRVWCDDEAMQRRPRPDLNLIRPTDGWPVLGTVVCTSTDGPDTASLDDRECALWLATLALIGVDPREQWRRAALAELVPHIHIGDAALFDRLRTHFGV